MGRNYEMPDDFDQSDVIDLTPENQHSAELKPTSMVICINRGPKPVNDMFDAQTYHVPGHAKFRCEYQVAMHLQRRNVVPGTRNPNPGDSSEAQFVPWIAIVGIDPDARVFTAEELAKFGESVEGLNRSLLASPSGREVVVADTNQLRKALPGAGVTSSATAGMKPDQQVYGGTDESRAAAMDKVSGGEAASATEAALSAGWTPPAHVEQTSAPAPKEQTPRGTRKGNRTS